MSIVGPGVRHENLKSWKMRNTHSRTWNMAKMVNNLKNEKYTL
jgi:hypothetical protein